MFKFKFFLGSINVIYKKLERHIDYSALIISAAFILSDKALRSGVEC